MADKIRHRITRCLNNELHPDELTDDEQSYLEFFIYKAACRLIVEPSSIDVMPSNLIRRINRYKRKLLQMRKR